MRLDEQAGLATAGAPRPRPRRRRQRGGIWRSGARRLTLELVATLVRGAPDATLERRFGSALALRTLRAAMAASFQPARAADFQGELEYELERPATRRPSVRFTIAVLDGRATARRGAASEPALRLRLRLSDFLRVAVGEIDPVEPLLHGQASIEGDLALAARLAEMFGAPPPH